MVDVQRRHDQQFVDEEQCAGAEHEPVESRSVIAGSAASAKHPVEGQAEEGVAGDGEEIRQQRSARGEVPGCTCRFADNPGEPPQHGAHE